MTNHMANQMTSHQTIHNPPPPGLRGRCPRFADGGGLSSLPTSSSILLFSAPSALSATSAYHSSQPSKPSLAPA